ncbi:hypothetical protein MPER_10403, partial [Moniliophthora perniciosa FA553]
MLDIPTRSLSNAFAAVVDDVDSKVNSANLYHHSVQIIELVECPAPPRRIINNDCSYASTSYVSSSYTSSASEDDEEAEEEVECSSYCSSEEDLQASPQPLYDEDTTTSTTTCAYDTYSLRMKRILSWRKNFSAQMGSTLSEPSLSSPLKRKLSTHVEDLDDDV